MNARRQCCILSKFYIKPQLPVGASSAVSSCILSKFYIKPQQRVRHKIGHSCCILSKFYIKPQLLLYHRYNESVVSYRNSTSNHNTGNKVASPWLLYLIEILHQTTTIYVPSTTDVKLYLIEILHQTTTIDSVEFQRQIVVSYRNSTSNHNVSGRPLYAYWVVSYRNSTSNHNGLESLIKDGKVVSYRNSTSNHNIVPGVDGEVIVVSYRNSTSNHNKRLQDANIEKLYLIEILHQTTTLSLT